MSRRRREGDAARRMLGVAGIAFSIALAFASAARADTARLAAAPRQDALDAEYAGVDEESATARSGFPDPFEGVNRKTLLFNQQVDRFVLDPITRAYRFIIPDPAKRAIRRAFTNLGSTSIFVNDLLQREWKDAGVTAGRLVLNSTFGMAGFVDVAAEVGLPEHHSDFGQTMALVGVPSGPFLMLPVLGPTNARDGTGYVVDLFFRPTTWLLGPANLLFLNSNVLFGPGEQLVLNTIQTGSSGIALLEEHSEELRLLKESSVDYYAALRNAYYQNRTAEIWSRREHHRGSGEADDGETRSAGREEDGNAG